MVASRASVKPGQQSRLELRLSQGGVSAMKQHRVEGDTAYLDRAWGTLIMDAEDLPLLDGFKLEVRNGYLRLRDKDGKRKNGGSLSRSIMGNPVGMFVDHINHNTLDNRKCNLRICTPAQSRQNNRGSPCLRRSGQRYKGVYHTDDPGNAKHPWRAICRREGKRVSLGYYTTEIEAAMAFNRNAEASFGAFACFNRFDSCPVLNTSREATAGQA